MPSINKVILIGHLTKDPETRTTSGGTALATLGLAMNRKFNGGGTLQEEVTFVDVTVWGKTAENCERYLTKGRAVYVEGRLKLDTWDDKNTGQRRSKLTVVAESIQFLGGQEGDHGGGGRTPSGPRRQSSPRREPPQPNNYEPEEPEEDDISW